MHGWLVAVLVAVALLGLFCAGIAVMARNAENAQLSQQPEARESQSRKVVSMESVHLDKEVSFSA